MKAKVEWMFFITYGELVFSSLHLIAQRQELTIGGIFGYCFMLMFVYWILWDVISFIGHLAVSIYFFMKGLGFSPVLIYPFVFSQIKIEYGHCR